MTTLPASSGSPPHATAKKVRLLTYNIHKAIGGLDRRYRPQRIIDTIAHHEPDIVLLQEVDDGVPRSNRDRQVDLFAEALEFPHTAFQRNVQLTQGHYGNAILSRFPLTDVENVDLSIPLKKKRRALLTHCRIRWSDHQRTLLLVNLHLGLAGFERKLQLQKLLSHPVVQHTRLRTPTILGGDYNDVWESLGKRIMGPAGFASAGHRIRTFPAALPTRALDHLYYRGDLTLDHAFACRAKTAQAASDHLPLIADFWLQQG